MTYVKLILRCLDNADYYLRINELSNVGYWLDMARLSENSLLFAYKSDPDHFRLHNKLQLSQDPELAKKIEQFKHKYLFF